MMQSTFHAVGDPRSTAIQQRAGLTMLEVIFAMVVILVGLVAVGLLIPLAGRQAADSYQITQGLAAGESAVAMVNTANVAQPTLETPWCLVDDNFDPSNPPDYLPAYSQNSLQNAYERIAILPTIFRAPADVVQAAVAQNEAIGFGFCVDPLFWGYQSAHSVNPTPPLNPLPNPFVRDRFPLLSDRVQTNTGGIPAADPISLTVSSPPVPRLIRVSLIDPRPPINAQRPFTWIGQSPALRLATMAGGDLVQVSPDRNRASAPLRAIYTSPTTGFPLTGGPTAIDTPSWLMTVTPAENTPIIPLSMARENYVASNINSNRPVQIPRTYNVAVVVFSKRDARDVNPNINPALQNLPVSERVFRVSDIGSEALNTGSFSVTLDTHPAIDPKIKIGDWLMMSRYTKQDLLPRSAGTVQAISRQVHRWYRVVSLTDEQFLSAATPPLIRRTVRVAGKPWDWTQGEINDLKERNAPMPTVPPLPSVIETHAVLLRDVVHVYERQMELQ